MKVTLTAKLEFNQEIGRRLASLDRCEHVDPGETRARLQRKSEARRKQKVSRQRPEDTV